MTLRQMQYFESVARTHNLTKSAQELYISQPSLSVSMKALEQEVKVSLFQRDGTHIRLTDAGQTLAIEINSVLKQYEKMQQIIRSGNLERNYVRFGFSTLVGDFSAPLICHKFLDTFPGFHIHLTQSSGRDLLQKLEQRQLDVVLTGQKYSENSGWSGKFESHPMHESVLAFCVSKLDPRSHMKNITMAEIAKQPVILPDETFPASMRLESFFASEGYPLNIILRSSQVYTILRFISTGIAGGFLPSTSCLENTSIISIPCGELTEELFMTSMLFWNKDAQISPALDAFIQCAQTITTA